ncbi:MAG: tetratricopeptide repeat protein [Desulfobulbaceae bacterium]|jgi:TolA-binding protein|nr:tetratricopeptide repeat protein [Desulfobulbaceae bacterium]
MKKITRIFLLALPLLPLLSHCAPYSEVERLQNQLRTVNRRMEDMRNRRASSGEEVSQLREQTQNLQSQLDDANQANARLKERNQSLEASIGACGKQESGKRDEAISRMEESLQAKDEKIAALEKQLQGQQDNNRLIQSKKVSDTEKALKEAQAKAEAARAKAKTLSTSPPAGTEVKRITSGQTKIMIKPATAVANKPAVVADGDPFNQVPANPPAPAKSAAAVPPPAAPKGPEPSTPAAASTSDKLAEGKQLYADKQYAKARTAFEAYLASKPSANQAAEADYMIGECNYQNKQYDLAIISYQKVASKPTLSKAAAATLKQGMAFEQMADVEMAKTIYKKLIDQHPGTPEAKTAQEKLGKL